jgi:hypothetical protein
MPRIDYYDTDAKLLMSRGTGALIARRIISRDEFDSITKNNAPVDLDKLLVSHSKEITIDPNRGTFLDTLVDHALGGDTEMGAYITLQYSTGILRYNLARPANSSNVHFTFSVTRFRDVALVPSDYTRQVIGTVHTHYADVAAMDAKTPGVHHSIAPQVSDLDRMSAKDNQFFVYAIDRQYVHKAFPDGTVQNKLPRDLDILIDAIDSYGRAFSKP